MHFALAAGLGPGDVDAVFVHLQTDVHAGARFTHGPTPRMTELTFAHAQADMRRSYLFGAPGILVSGLVWLASALVAILVSEKVAVLALLIGGAAIHPLAVLTTKLLGGTGSHTPGNPLGRLAIEGTFWLLAGIAIAYGIHLLRLEWFFPAMLLLVGGRYLTFQTVYGLRTYWFCGAALCVVGLALALARAPAAVGAFAGAVVELIFAAVVFGQARRHAASLEKHPSRV